jgi:iron only hydrogenase large subunit-like protein
VIEIMACPGGCINGGGQPYSEERMERIEERIKVLYQIDSKLKVRKSHQNQSIKVERVKQIIMKLGTAGVVMTKCGQSTLRIAPALSITEAIADEVIDIIIKVLKDYEKEF